MNLYTFILFNQKWNELVEVKENNLEEKLIKHFVI